MGEALAILALALGAATIYEFRRRDLRFDREIREANERNLQAYERERARWERGEREHRPIVPLRLARWR